MLLRQNVFWFSIAACNIGATAFAQVPNGTKLNLAGFVPSLNVAAGNPIILASGIEPWWGPYQLPLRSFSPSVSFLNQGIPPNGAYPALLGTAIKTANYAFPTPYWSGYSNELSAYSNADLGIDLSVPGMAGNPLSTNNGVVSLTVRKMTSVEQATLPSILNGHTYVSGALNTYPAAQEYGYFEETAKIPSGSGLWSSFWLWPQNMNLPPCTTAASCNPEIDIMEILGNAPSVLNTTIHTSDKTSLSYPAHTLAYQASPTLNFSQGFHRFGMDWEYNYITFYLDGVSYYSVKTPSDMHQPFFIITGLAVGLPNQWAGPVNSSTPMPASMGISALRVWRMP